jgi:hypothetical protein
MVSTSDAEGGCFPFAQETPDKVCIESLEEVEESPCLNVLSCADKFAKTLHLIQLHVFARTLIEDTRKWLVWLHGGGCERPHNVQ